MGGVRKLVLTDAVLRNASVEGRTATVSVAASTAAAGSSVSAATTAAASAHVVGLLHDLVDEARDVVEVGLPVVANLDGSHAGAGVFALKDLDLTTGLLLEFADLGAAAADDATDAAGRNGQALAVRATEGAAAPSAASTAAAVTSLVTAPSSVTLSLVVHFFRF